MTTISCKDNTKAEFDRLKPEDYSHDEFVEELLETYENADEPVTIDTEEIAQNIKESVASEVELAAYRGTQEALENTQ